MEHLYSRAQIQEAWLHKLQDFTILYEERKGTPLEQTYLSIRDYAQWRFDNPDQDLDWPAWIAEYGRDYDLDG